MWYRKICTAPGRKTNSIRAKLWEEIWELSSKMSFMIYKLEQMQYSWRESTCAKQPKIPRPVPPKFEFFSRLFAFYSQTLPTSESASKRFNSKKIKQMNLCVILKTRSLKNTFMVKSGKIGDFKYAKMCLCLRMMPLGNLRWSRKIVLGNERREKWKYYEKIKIKDGKIEK